MNHDIRDCLLNFHKYLSAEGYQAVTLKNLGDYDKTLLTFCDGSNITSVKEITRDTVSAYGNYVRRIRRKDGKRVSTNWVLKRLHALRGFLKYIREEGLINLDLAELIDFPRMNSPLPKGVPSEEEIEKLFKYFDDLGTSALTHRDRMIIEIGYGLGLRLREIQRLSIDEIDLESNRVLIKNSKFGKSRYLPLAPILKEKVKRFMDVDRRVLVIRGGGASRLILNNQGEEMKLTQLHYIIKKHFEAVGIVGSSHSLRRGFATHIHKSGAGILYINRLLGHSSLETSMIYTRIYPKDLLDLVDNHHPRANLEIPKFSLPRRVTRIRFSYLLALKSQGLPVPGKAYTSKKVTRQPPPLRD